MAARTPAGELMDALAALEIGTASDIAAARRLARIEATEAAQALRSLIGHAKRSTRAGHALAVAARALELASEDDLPPEQRGRICQAAVDAGLVEVAALFVRDRPAREVDPRLCEAPDPVVGHLTLGHKKMLARRADGDRIARFAMESDPRVIRELLINPRLTEERVVRIASRRPACVPVLFEIWRSTRWCTRTGVRKALAMNPYTPPSVSLKIVPHLSADDLDAVTHDAALHARVRALASRLLEDTSGRLRSRRPLDQAAEEIAEGGDTAGQDDQAEEDD